MSTAPYSPILELWRGDVVESIHYGAFAIVDVSGKLIASHGNPQTITYTRSSAKPIQALSFLEQGGKKRFDLELKEIALICASHAGTDEHISVLKSIQTKTGVQESNLLCGVHPLSHRPTIEAMQQRGEKVTPNRHNCSGKHTGMLAYANLLGLPKENYIHNDHPVQRRILQTFAEMCNLPLEEITIGIDGCSAPNFAIPLYNLALAFARLCDPDSAEFVPTARAGACRLVTSAMTSHPEMVSGPNGFDTHLMQTANGRIISKGGAEGYLAMGLLPNAIKPGSPGIGVSIKIADGDLKGHSPVTSKYRGAVRPAVALEILSFLGALNQADLTALSLHGPKFPMNNWREINVGEGKPCFQLQFNEQ